MADAIGERVRETPPKPAGIPLKHAPLIVSLRIKDSDDITVFSFLE
jgi:hypothetical protein